MDPDDRELWVIRGQAGRSTLTLYHADIMFSPRHFQCFFAVYFLVLSPLYQVVPASCLGMTASNLISDWLHLFLRWSFSMKRTDDIEKHTLETWSDALEQDITVIFTIPEINTPPQLFCL